MQRYSGLDERILTNIIRSAEGEKISRSRARYSIVDVPAPEFDKIMEQHGVRTLVDRKTRGQYYLVSEIVSALKKLCLSRGVRPKIDVEKLKRIGYPDEAQLASGTPPR